MKRWLIPALIALAAAPCYAAENVASSDAAPVVASPVVAVVPTTPAVPDNLPATLPAPGELTLSAPTSPEASADAPAAAVETAPAEPAEPLTPVPEDYSVRASLLAHSPLKVGASSLLNIQLTHANGRYVKPRELRVVHTRPIHLLVVDSTLTDYQHLHPKAAKSGKWRVSFTPKKPGPYRMFVDVTPLNGAHQYIKVDMEQMAKTAEGVDTTTSNVADVDGYHFTLAFDEAPKSGREVMGHVKVADKYGNPVTTLEPVMGAFAHIVAFSEDRESVLHVHPLGQEPTSRLQRGGPELDFHFEPEKFGFVKFYVQVKINGKDVFAPFGVDVAQ